MIHPPRLSVHFLTVGECRHCERIALQGGALRPISFPSICALIVHPKEGPILYDTGYSERFQECTETFPERLYRWITPVALPAEQRLEKQLSEFGIRLEDIRACLISHFHADHIAGLRDIPNARFFALSADVQNLNMRSRLKGLLNGFIPSLLPCNFSDRLTYADQAPRRSLGAAWSSFGDGFDLFGDGALLAFPLPGHSAGHMGLRFRDDSDREVFLCADACWSMTAWQQLRYPSWLTRPIMHDWQHYRKTIQQIHQLGTERPELAILPSHCPVSLAEYQVSKPVPRTPI